MTDSFWAGRRVLLTGHSGFKGSWLALWLRHLGAQVTGISLPPTNSPNLFTLAGIDRQITSHFCDIRDLERVRDIVHSAQPEIVLHLAAQALVRPSYRDPIATFSTNFMGTAHVLEALRGQHCLRVAVMITTDKVYRNLEWPYPYREDDALGGHDPYSASKAACEILIASYRDAFLKNQGVALASARAGNVIGGGDWSEDRLIPDAVRAWERGETLCIRSPEAIRPWQHVLEPLAGYLALARKLWDEPGLAGAYNFGPETSAAASVHEVIEIARRAYGTATVHYEKANDGPHEAGWLSLEIAKSRTLLGITPQWNLRQSIERTMNWYRDQSAGHQALGLCEQDIAAYEDTRGAP